MNEAAGEHGKLFMLPTGEHVAAKEAAHLLGCSSQTVRNLVDDGTLQGAREPRGTRATYFVQLASVKGFIRNYGRYPEAATRPRARMKHELAANSREHCGGVGAAPADMSDADHNSDAVLAQRVRELEQTTRVQSDTIRRLVQASEAEARAHELMRAAAYAHSEAAKCLRDSLADLSEHVGLDGIPSYPPDLDAH